MNKPVAKVTFHFLDVKFPFNKRTELKKFIVSIFSREGRALESISYIFCSDEHLLEMNKTFLDHDYYTDIITFGLSDKDTDPIEGEVYISVDRVRDNALVFKSPFIGELHRVIFHGALHLCGYKDKKKSEQVIMRRMEDHYLSLMDIEKR